MLHIYLWRPFAYVEVKLKGTEAETTPLYHRKSEQRNSVCALFLKEKTFQMSVIIRICGLNC